ncbi:hypothetical protein AB1E18_005713 [Capra hircus]
MENWNITADFILLGLFNHTGAHQLLFVLVLIVAFTSPVGNALMFLLIFLDPRLHRPMYFLLSQLSLMDLMLIFTVVPRTAVDYLTGRKFISTTGCEFQIFSFLSFGEGECFLLAAMSYDYYVAVCHPLRYPVLMSWKLCLSMILGSWFLGAADGLMQAAATLNFSFCSAQETDHFFCEAPTPVMYICCVLMLLIPISLILIFYSLILAVVLQMCSNEACKKAFATCSSHISVVGVFFGAAIFTYMRPKSYRSANHDKFVSAFYSIFTPVLNPLIYSLRTVRS